MSRSEAVEARTIPRLTAGQLHDLARSASERYVNLLPQLDEAQWALPTDCTLWTVREIALHQVAVAESWSSIPELLRQYLIGVPETVRLKGLPVDGANAVGVRDRSHLSRSELLQRTRLSQERILAVRRNSGPVVRAIPLPSGPLGWITVGDLFDIILTRDTWTHRLDICRATGLTFEIDPERDREFVADLVREWAGRHGKPFELVLTGPAGRVYTSGSGGERIEIDAVEFARTLSGRAPGQGLLAQQVLF